MVRLSNKKVGGIRFIRIGRLSFSFCVSKPVNSSASVDRLTFEEMAHCAIAISVVAYVAAKAVA